MDLSPTEIRTVVIGAMLALFLAALDQTVVATALPSIAKDLGGFALISWIVIAYLLTATCITPLVGKLSDLYGRRAVLRICLGVFILGSVLCALAPSMILLILARAVQGVGGGGLMTMAQTIIGDVVSPRERGRYAGYFSIVWGSSSVLGPTIGGVVTDQIGWPWIFWINLPLGLLALVISDHALRKLPVAGRRSALEFAGIVLLCAATIALLLIFAGRPPHGLGLAANPHSRRRRSCARGRLCLAAAAIAGADLPVPIFSRRRNRPGARLDIRGLWQLSGGSGTGAILFSGCAGLERE